MNRLIWILALLMSSTFLDFATHVSADTRTDLPWDNVDRISINSEINKNGLSNRAAEVVPLNKNIFIRLEQLSNFGVTLEVMDAGGSRVFGNIDRNNISRIIHFFNLPYVSKVEFISDDESIVLLLEKLPLGKLDIQAMDAGGKRVFGKLDQRATTLLISHLKQYEDLLRWGGARK